ncbi:hypothetical protein ABEB36_001564 [Hypothenemus hampei]|uniref:Uncharacterized protein n=1 Tax=Hypothenemus hampei TaxID=57062 RepID=A0ABD1FI63_HYPHA
MNNPKKKIKTEKNGYSITVKNASQNRDVAYCHLYRYATFLDKLLIAIGIVGSIISGVSQPYLIVLFGYVVGVIFANATAISENLSVEDIADANETLYSSTQYFTIMTVGMIAFLDAICVTNIVSEINNLEVFGMATGAVFKVFQVFHQCSRVQVNKLKCILTLVMMSKFIEVEGSKIDLIFNSLASIYLSHFHTILLGTNINLDSRKVFSFNVLFHIIRNENDTKGNVAIARALLIDLKILLSDEAILDNESEKIVQEALDTSQKGKTCITINLICGVKEGKVYEMGSHNKIKL